MPTTRVSVFDLCGGCSARFAEDDYSARQVSGGGPYRAFYESGTNRYYCQGCRRTCSSCSGAIVNSCTRTALGRDFCANCYDRNVSSCSGCGQEFLTTNSNSTTSACRACLLTCTKCRASIVLGDERHAQNDAIICSLCVKPEDDGDDIGDPETYEFPYQARITMGIQSYSTVVEAALSTFGQPIDGLFMGVELEVETGVTAHDHVAKDVTHSFDGFVICKSDGSIGHGFEIVTAPASFEEQVERWSQFFTHKYPLTSFKSGRCGMHVHVSKAALSPSQLARLNTFIYAPRNTALVEMIAQRNLRSGWGAQYAAITKKRSLLDGLSIKQKKATFSYERFRERGALNFGGNHNTVEFRIFRGTMKPSSFLKNLEFVHALVQFCKPGTASFKDYERPEAFKRYVSEHKFMYRNLNSYIQEREDKLRVPAPSLLQAMSA